jgi:hypothetical protein
MKRLAGDPFDRWRLRTQSILEHYGNFGDETCGVFRVPILGQPIPLHVVASAGEGWDHVSASLPRRCPTWEEMVRLKRAFFEADEWAVEFHPAVAGNISLHPYTLHLWRPQGIELPRPPGWMVG